MVIVRAIKPRIVTKILLYIFLSFSAVPLQAAIVRGRIQRPSMNAGVPGVPVTVWCPQLGRSSPVYSGPDGMYYIQNIPPGIYNLEIWLTPGGAPLVYQIRVVEPFADVLPINLP